MMKAERIIEIDYAQCSKALLRNIGVILLVTVLSFVIGASAVYFIMDHEDLYRARSSVISTSGDVYEETLDIVQYADIVKSLKVAERASTMLNDESLNSYDIYNMIEVVYDDSQYTTVSSAVISITAQSNDADEAIRVVNALAKAYVVEVFDITKSDRFKILDLASQSDKIYNSQNQMILYTVLAGVIGFILSIAFIILHEILALRLKTVKDGTLFGTLDIIGVIPRYDKKKIIVKRDNQLIEEPSE